MIRINLLEPDKPRVRVVPFARFGLGPHNLTIGCAIILAVGAAVIGWRYWQIQQQSATLNSEMDQAQNEAVQLRSVLAEVQQFEQRRTQLQQRVGLIETLRRDQTGPVHMLDEISRALTPTLWLVDLKQSPTGGDVVIDGRCTVLTGLTDFVTNLEKSGYFKKSIEIVNTQIEASQGGPDVIRFSVKAEVDRPAAAPVDAAKAAIPRPAN